MIERRSLVKAALVLPAMSFVANASACSYAPYEYEDSVDTNSNVRNLFKSWFQKDRQSFEKFLGDTPNVQGDFADSVRDGLSTSLSLYDDFFNDSDYQRTINFMVNTGGEILLGCYEIDISNDADHGACEDTPYFHKFNIETIDNKPYKIDHISTTRNPYVRNIGVWTNG